ncbi:MAG TPA: sigma-70 family RNA polymerase sigma factor [Roseiflexaceae bacterium]|nr:sigma-70 family RNA polymerase sigma factor [Roseiflexaceae bacterium]HMP40801.1 sigma-70 family RNA polymerase sigma factor [Roseiflexaceae bacterium]
MRLAILQAHAYRVQHATIIGNATMQHLNDSELVVLAKAGDHQAFTQIYERYATAIYRYIYFRINDAELAEDIQSDVFLRMLEGIHRYEDRGWPISAWLYRIAHDRTVDMIRRRRIRQHVPLEDWGGCCDGPETALADKVDNEIVYRMLDDLTNEQRQVIQLRFMGDMSIQEVARRLGRTEGAVKALQHRGLQSLARRLG